MPIVQQQPCAECGRVHGDHRAGMAALRDAALSARMGAVARRARVLAHPDIAAALTDPPLSYTSPEKWNGAVPPATVPTKYGWKPNHSPRRTALIEICQLVAAREEVAAKQEAIE